MIRRASSFLVTAVAAALVVGCSLTEPSDGAAESSSAVSAGAGSADTNDSADKAAPAGISPGKEGEGCGPVGPIERPCEKGLFCKYATGICGAGPGTCTVQPNVCPLGLVADEVCGCDGKTYDSPCWADAAGVSVRGKGACCAFAPAPIDAAVLASVTWQSADKTFTYGFDKGGRFWSTHGPACLYADPPCDPPVVLLTGSYTIIASVAGAAASTVVLSYDGAATKTEIAFASEANCTGARALEGNDYGAHVVLLARNALPAAR